MSNLNSPVNQEAAKTTSETNASFLRAARAGNLDKVLEYLKENIDINTSNSNGLNALHLASKEGHVRVVDELLKQKADVNAATKKGNTALHIASLAGQQSVVELLVKSGANVDCRSQNGFTPLYMAAQENHLEVVRFLLANSANQSLATEDGFTPLAVALQQGHEKVVALLLENDSRGKIRLPALHIAAKKNDVKAAALLLSNDPNMDLSPEARMVNCTTKAGKSGFTPLHIAAHYGNVEIAKYLISKGANVNYEARQNITPLHVATKWGKGNSVNLLLENGAKIDAKTRDGLTPLHCAARSGHEEVVELLIAKQAPINAKTKNGLTALHMAAQGDHVEAARILLYHSPKLVDQTTCDFLTALHVAAHCGHVKIAKLLIDHKADVNSRALNGFTPLHIACKKNRIKVIELLIKHGASKEATTESGLTPLHVASFMGCMNVVVFLIQHGSLPNVPTIRGETPLHLAARANQTDIVRILLRHGASVDAKAKEQQTPLHIATRLGNTDIIALLLRHGAFVDAPTSDGYTPLHIASKEGQEEVASILFENGASLNVTTKKGFTPLHIAAKYGNIKVASLLLQRDAQPDIQGKNGLTPLHVATHYNRPSLAHLLLQHNASPHIVAKNGYSALHIAAKKNQLDIATTLLEYNAHTNCESNAGFTPLHLACQEGHLDMASLLLDHKAEPGASSKNGLTPLHLCAQEDKVNCAAVLVKMNAAIDPQTKAGYTPLHVACHFGQINMVKFLLGHMADVNIITKHGFTALHCAAQQGHVLIVKLLLEHGASPDITNNNGQTPLAIAQRLGYISVIEELRQVTQTTLVSTTIKTTEEKYKVQTPETMQETFMSDSEDEMGDEAMFGDAEHYKYLTNEADLNNAADDSIALTPKTPKRDDSTKLPSPQTPILNADLDLVANQDENHINEHELRPESPNIQQAKSQPEKFIANSLGNMSMAESMDGSFYNGYASSKHVNLLNETDNIPIESKPKSTGLHLNSFTNLTSSYQKSIDFSVFSSHADNLNSSGAHFNAHVKDFLISFMVDARGGAMKGCRHSGVRVIIPPKRASMPTRITCRFVRKEKLAVAPPLNESESLAARVLEMGPQGCKFLGPVVLEIPHYASLRGREREIVVLRSDAGEKWHEHPIVASESAVEEALGCTLELLSAQSLEPDAAGQQPAHDDSLSQVSSSSRLRITRIITHDFPKYFALVSRVRHETHAVSESGGVISSTIVPKAQAVFPEKALQKKIKLSLQAMPIAHDLVCKMFGNRVVVSPIVTIEPRRRKFHKAITLTIPLPKSPFKGMLNSYSHTNDSYSLRLLCSITGGLAPAQWEDITGHTPLSYIDECVSFTTTVSARFWLMDCQNVAEATKMATELYREAIAVPFMARFVVYAKRHEHTEAKLRVYCITDDKEEKTLEQREAFVVVAKSKEVEVLDNRVQWLEMSGNIAPVTLNKSSVNCALSASADQLNMSFVSFYENRLPFTVRVKDAEQSAVNGRLVFLKDSRTTLTKLDAATRSQPVCTLDIQLPSYDREQIEHDESKKRATLERGQLSLRSILNDSSATLLSQGSACRHTGHVTGFNLRLLANDLSNLVDAFDWVNLAKLLELTEHDIEQIKKLSSNSPNLLSASLANQTYDMLVYFVHKFDEQAHDQHAASFGHVLSKALQEMGVEADLVERNSYTLSGLLPQSAENIFSVEKSLNNKLNERGEHHHGQGQLESSISQLKEAVDLYNNHEDRDIMKESESAQNSDNENEHDLVHNLPKENQIELSSLINQIDKQMDELERDNERGDDLVSTVIIGEEHMDKKENGYVAKTIVDTVIQGISAKQFDNFNQHIEEVTQVTSLVEDKQETSDNEAMRHSNSDPEYAHKINAEYEAIKRNILSRTGDNEILVRSPTVPKSSKKLDKVIDSHLSSLIPPLDQSSNLNSSYYDNLDHSDSDFTCNRKIDPFLHDHEQMSTLDEDDSESVMNKSNTSELLNDIIQHVMIAEDQAEQLNKLDTDDEFTWQNLVLSHSSNLNSDDDEDKLSIKDLIQESVINQQNQLEEVEQAIHRDEDYYHDDDDDDEDEYDDNYDHDPDAESGRNNLNDDKNADCEEIFIKLDRSQLREFEFNSYDFDSNENSKFQNIEQQSPIIEQELMTTGQELENLKQRLVMSESVSEVTQNVLDSIRKEYSIEEKSYAEEIDPSQCIDPMVQQVIENLAKESASEMEKIIMVEPFDNEVVYDSDSDEIDEFVKNENDDDGKDCLLESSSSEMSSLKNKIQAEHHENQDTELDQDSAWYHHTDQNESENLMEKLSQTKQYQTFESSSSSSLNDDTDQKEKSSANVQVKGAEENNDTSVSIVIHGSTSSTADENDIKLDRSNLTIDLIKVSESREKLIENDHLQRVESSYDICSYENEQLVVGQSTDDISAATTIIEQQRFTPNCEAYYISSEAEVTDDENKIELENSNVFLDIPIQKVINQSESSEPLILGEQVDQEVISNSSASVNSINSSTNSSSHYSLTTSDENMAKNLLDNENNESKSSSSSINFDDSNRKNISKSLNFLESLVVPSNVDPNEQIEEYTILLERQNELNKTHLIEHETFKNIKSDLSPMKTSLSLNFNKKSNKQIKIERPKEINFISSDFSDDYYNKECFDHQTPTPVENTAGSFFDKRITSSNEPSIDMFDKASSTDNSEKVDLNDCVVENLINQLSDPEHAEEEVAAAFATAYLFSSNVNSQSNEELKSQIDIASEEEAFGPNRFFGIDNEAYASSKSSRESVIINYEYDDTDDQQQMKIKIIQATNPSKSIICSSYGPQNLDESNESFENNIHELNEINQDVTDDIIIHQDELEQTLNRTPNIELDRNDDENILTNESSIEYDDLIEKVSNISENYYNQDKEPLLSDDYVEIFENIQEEQAMILHPIEVTDVDKKLIDDSNLISSSKMEEFNLNIVTEEGVELDDQSFLISTPTNEIEAIHNDDLEFINYSDIAKHLVGKTINDSIEKILIENLNQHDKKEHTEFNEIKKSPINIDDKLNDSQNNEQNEISSFQQSHTSMNDDERKLNSYAIQSSDSEKNFIIINESQTESNDKHNLEENIFGLYTPIVVLEHVSSEPNSDQEFDPEACIENSNSHEICIETIEKNNQELAKQIVDSIITNSIEKLNQIPDDPEKTDLINLSIIKGKSEHNFDNSNQLNLKEVRFNTNVITSSQDTSIDCFDNELLNLQQIILNSNFENTFNQINKLNCQNSDLICSPKELAKIIEDKFEDDQLTELDYSDHLIYIEAKKICDFVIDKAIKSIISISIEKNDLNENFYKLKYEEEEKQTEKKIDKTQNSTLHCFLENEPLKDNSNLDFNEIRNYDAQVIDSENNATFESELISSQSFDALDECQLLENMKKPLLTSSFISDTLPSDSENDPASYHTALSGLNESKNVFSSSNYLTAHDDQDSNSQHQISASDSFYSANSKLKSLNSSNFSSYSNANNSYNNLDESYSTLNDTNNCSDFEHTIISESNDESKYEDVQSFIKDMQPLIETNLEANIVDNEKILEPTINFSPNQDSVTSSSSSVASIENKSLSANTISTNMINTSSPSSSIEINKQLEQADNESCTSSVLEFEKIEEQCMDNTDDSSRIDSKNEIKDDTYSFFESTVILSNDLNTIYETNEKESSSATSSPLSKSDIKLEANQLETTLIKNDEANDVNQIDLTIDLSKSNQNPKNQSASATTSPIQSPTCYRPKNIGSTSSLTKQVLQIQQLSTSRSSSSSSIKSTDSFENELKTKVKIDDNSYFAKIRQNTPPLIETKNESSDLLDTPYNIRKKASKRTSRTSSSTSSTSSTSVHGENICNKLSILNASMGTEASVLTSSSSSNLKQSVLTAEDLPSFKKSALSLEQNSSKVTSSVSSSNISSDPSKTPSLNQNLSQSANLEKKDEIHRSSSSHSHHSSDCYCGKSSPSLISTTNMSTTNNPTSSSSCFSFTTQGNDLQSNIDEKQLNVNVPSDSTSS